MSGSEIRFTSRTVVEQPVAEVFDRLAQLPAYGRWMHHSGLFRRCRLTSAPPVREGTTYVDHTWMGRFDGVVVEFVPPTRIAFRESLRWFGRPVTAASPGYVLEADGAGTVVHHVAVGELYGWMRIARPVAAGLARWERMRTLTSLARSFGPAR